MSNEAVFAAYPSAVIYDEPKGKAVKSLLWGDYIRVTGAADNGWLPVTSRGVKGWIQKKRTQPDRILEVIFVDIGQGDGCLVVTPDDRHVLIDAGAGDNFRRFLRWRYNDFEKPRHFDAVIISHPDSDHYLGFRDLFKEPNVTVGAVYHNGLVERAGLDALGRVATENGARFMTDVVRTQEDLDALLADPAAVKDKLYPTMLRYARTSKRVGEIRALCVDDTFVPGYTDADAVTLEVLGPVVEKDAVGAPRLRCFDEKPRKSVGKTKNGHSVVVKLKYGAVSMLLGGDLNIPSEYLLLAHHTGMPVPPTNAEDERLIVEAARRVFQCDIAKSCHHGSSDFSDLFLQAVNPIATVVSSGDNEAYAHPRADTLGTVGRFSRGARPLIFSTELSRSATEMIKKPSELRRKFRAALDACTGAADDAARERATARFDKLLAEWIQRSVAVYGAINVRTDGDRVVIAYRIESPRKKDNVWDIYKLERTPSGILRFMSKHELEE